MGSIPPVQGPSQPQDFSQNAFQEAQQYIKDLQHDLVAYEGSDGNLKFAKESFEKAVKIQQMVKNHQLTPQQIEQFKPMLQESVEKAQTIAQKIEKQNPTIENEQDLRNIKSMISMYQTVLNP